LLLVVRKATIKKKKRESEGVTDSELEMRKTMKEMQERSSELENKREAVQ
jgi:uncharacterized protein YlxW (UPF0749 family)